MIVRFDVPFGRANTPLSDPFWSALLNWEVKVASVTPARLLLAKTYFLRAWRLLCACIVSKCSSPARAELLPNWVAPATTRLWC